MTTTAQTIEEVAASLGLAMQADFIPWSKSRNKGEKSPSLNWTVRIMKGDRLAIETDYSAGCGHCPAYKATIHGLPPSDLNGPKIARKGLIEWECENGKTGRAERWGDIGFRVSSKTTPILPTFADVLHSLVMDSEAIDYTFEDWASNYGYDTDSRKAEAAYRACLDIGIKMRQAIGDAGLAKLREACQDY